MDELTKKLWGKSNPRKTLLSHMVETGAVAKTLLETSCYSFVLKDISKYFDLSKKEIINTVSFLIALHDIGKCHPLFQSHLDDMNQEIRSRKIEYISECQNFRHELYSNYVIKRLVKNKYEIKHIEKVMGLHHQGKKGEVGLFDEDEKANIEWSRMQDELSCELENIFKPTEFQIKKEEIDISALCTLLLGLTILSDWIASSEMFENDEISLPYDKYLVYISEKATKFIEDSGILYAPPPKTNSFCETWIEIPKNGMRPVQVAVNNYLAETKKTPAALIIEAPMGEGKTEAGLFAGLKMAEACNKSGLYIGLPTAATSNAMYDRIDAFLGEKKIKGVKLIHSTAWMKDEVSTRSADFKCGELGDIDNEYAQRWMLPQKRGMLLPYCVGTVDQAMKAVLAVKYGVLRLFGLASKVLLIDEIHAYDAYMYDILKLLLKWCKTLNIPVVMLSATLPLEKKKELLGAYVSDPDVKGGYPLITAAYHDGTFEEIYVNGSYIKKTVEILTSSLLTNPQKIAENACQSISGGGCICVLMNTVKAAQAVYTEIKNQSVDIETLLFHACFPLKRRMEIEAECLSLFGKDKTNRPKKAVLVATQVVEQSLDLDFDRMFTAIAPIDLLLQRIGRVHRHEKTERPATFQSPQVVVLKPQDENYGDTEAVYPRVLLDRTKEYISQTRELHIPEDIPNAVAQVYDLSDDPDWLKYQFDNEIKESKARQFEVNEPCKRSFTLYNSNQPELNDDTDNIVFGRGKTRFGEESVRIAILEKELYETLSAAFSKNHNIDQKTAIEVMKNSVSISARRYFKLRPNVKERYIEGAGLLAGIKIFSGKNGICVLNNSMTIRFDQELGFVEGEAK